MYHYNGKLWKEQSLPSQVAEGVGSISSIVGERGNVYARAFWPETFVLRYNGTKWLVDTQLGDFRTMAYINRNEIYAQSCWGNYLWDGNQWTFYQGFDFCDANHIWGKRDKGGMLSLYTTGNNNFGNGVRVWQFTETYTGSMIGSWGSKYGTVFSDPPGYGYINAGTGTGIWGSNDVYVIGNRDGNGPTSGRVYHFDGTNWVRITSFGDIPSPNGVSGTGPDDVLVSLNDGRLLHYGLTHPKDNDKCKNHGWESFEFKAYGFKNESECNKHVNQGDENDSFTFDP